MLSEKQQDVLDNLVCDLEYSCTAAQLTEVIDNWQEFQSHLLKNITESKDKLELLEAEAEDENREEDRL